MVERFDKLKEDPDVERWSTLCRARRHPLLPAAQRAARQPFFAQTVIVAKDIEARERLRARLELLAEEFPSVVGGSRPLELGPPVGWPVQYRVSGPDPRGARDRLRLAEVLATNPRRDRSTSTGWSRANCASASTRTRRALLG